MNKRHLHHLWTRIRPIKTWYLLVAFLLFAGLHTLALRANYVTMTQLKLAVYEVDKNDGDVEAALQKLRAYVGSHMNTDLNSGNGVYPPIHLKYTYERLVKAEVDRVDAVNSGVYTSAQKYCEALHPESFFGRDRVPCIEQFVKQNGTSARAIADSQYKFDFVSPNWSPDAAGWSLVVASTLLVLTVIRFFLGRWLQTITK